MRGQVISPSMTVYWQTTGAADPTGVNSGYFGNIANIVIQEIYGA
jgi:hypothetical protein